MADKCLHGLEDGTCCVCKRVSALRVRYDTFPVEEFVAPATEPTLAEAKREAFDQGYLLGRMHSRRLAEGKRNAPAIPVVVRPYTPRARKFPESLENVEWAGVIKVC